MRPPPTSTATDWSICSLPVSMGPTCFTGTRGAALKIFRPQAGFTQSLPTSGAAAGDIDNDGDLDLYVTASSHRRFYLYINDGAGHFTEEAIARGAAAMEGSLTRRGMGVAFGDYDGDGYLDILTSDHSRPTATSGSRLLRNLGANDPANSKM